MKRVGIIPTEGTKSNKRSNLYLHEEKNTYEIIVGNNRSKDLWKHINTLRKKQSKF